MKLQKVKQARKATRALFADHSISVVTVQVVITCNWSCNYLCAFAAALLEPQVNLNMVLNTVNLILQALFVLRT